jgi:hypothetical protein
MLAMLHHAALAVTVRQNFVGPARRMLASSFRLPQHKPGHFSMASEMLLALTLQHTWQQMPGLWSGC